MDTDQKLAEILDIVKSERTVNNARFTQLTGAMQELGKKIDDVEHRLTAKIDRVYDTLSEDLQAFAGDQHKLDRRVKTLERKTA